MVRLANRTTSRTALIARRVATCIRTERRASDQGFLALPHSSERIYPRTPAAPLTAPTRTHVFRTEKYRRIPALTAPTLTAARVAPGGTAYRTLTAQTLRWNIIAASGVRVACGTQ